MGQAGGADCVLLTTGRPLGAHRIVLARRSRVLREMIAAEERPGLTDGGMLELLMPELRRDTALALREFLYTDTVRGRRPCEALSNLSFSFFALSLFCCLP